jgi:hypothetical protein
VVGAVRVDRPQALGVAEVAVDVLPAVVEDAPVGHHRAVSLEERGLADLVDVGAVAAHPEEVAHDVAVAPAVLRLARGGEDDVAARDVDRVDVEDALLRGQLLQARAVGADLVDVVVVLDAAPHAEDDPLAVGAHLGVADVGLRAGVEDRRDLAAGGQVERLQLPPAPVAPRVDLVRLEHRGGVVVVSPVLVARHEQDGGPGHERVGQERLPLQGLELLVRPPPSAARRLRNSPPFG